MALKLDRLVFGLMYRVGFIPWDGHELPSHLRKMVEGDTALPKGKALDVGCGTGDTAIYLARHGWDVTGVDFVERALDKARAKSEAAGVRIRYVRADATKLGQYGIVNGFDLVVDNGMLHGLSDADREAYVRDLTPLMRQGGRLFVMAFAEGKRRGPRGIGTEEVRRRFADGWQLMETGVDSEASNLPGDPLYFYGLRRSGASG